MKVLRISSDEGHKFIKGFDGETYNIFPAIVGEPYREIGEGDGDGYHCEITVDGQRWFVGQSAIVQSQHAQTGNSEDWAFSDGYKALLLYNIAHFIPSDSLSRSIDLRAGLPMADYKRHKKALTELYKRKFSISQPHRNKPLEINIRSIHWIPQGFAPLRRYIKKDRGVGDITIGIDLGSRNIAHVLINGRDVVLGKTDSQEKGATLVVSSIIKEVADLTGREYSFFEIQKVIETGKAKNKGKSFNVREIVLSHSQFYANSILSYLRNTLADDLDKADDIVLFGGGDYLAGDIIQAAYPKQVRRFDKPEFSTVEAQYYHEVG